MSSRLATLLRFLRRHLRWSAMVCDAYRSSKLLENGHKEIPLSQDISAFYPIRRDLPVSITNRLPRPSPVRKAVASLGRWFPRVVGVGPLTIKDPACGTGSFESRAEGGSTQGKGAQEGPDLKPVPTRSTSTAELHFLIHFCLICLMSFI